jgi:hypothetical protein
MGKLTDVGIRPWKQHGRRLRDGLAARESGRGDAPDVDAR